MSVQDIKSNKCSKCSRRTRSEPKIPLEKCFECKKKFCPNHFWRGQYNLDRMTIEDECRVVCDKCKNEYGYKDVGEIHLDSSFKMSLKPNTYTKSEEFREKSILPTSPIINTYKKCLN